MNLKYFLLLLLFPFFISCTDPCKKRPCSNGGTCVDGVCTCTAGYTDTFCDLKKNPVKIRITQIEVIGFNNEDVVGNCWDPDCKPDIFPVISSTGHVPFYDSTHYFFNAINTSTYSFTISPAFEITDMNASLSISLYDYDAGGQHQLMNYEDGDFNNPSDDFPATVTFGDNFSFSQYVLHLEYEF